MNEKSPEERFEIMPKVSVKRTNNFDGSSIMQDSRMVNQSVMMNFQYEQVPNLLLRAIQEDNIIAVKQIMMKFNVKNVA